MMLTFTGSFPAGIFGDPTAAVTIICVLYGASVLISSAEKIVVASDYGSRGWFAWSIFNFDRSNIGVFRGHKRLMAALFGPAGMVTVSLAGMLGVALIWVSPPRSMPFFVGACATLAATMSTLVRGFYGGDGSQQMNVIIGSAVVIGFNPWATPTTQAIALGFIAAQACLAYMTSGIAKFVSPMWRSGSALPGILATTSYGSPFAHAFAKSHPISVGAAAKLVMIFEATFIFAILGPPSILAIYLVFLGGFHVSSAFIMGLNTFLWSFVATFPAICFVWVIVHRLF